MAKTKVSPEQWEEARRWRAEGASLREVARRLGITPSRVTQKLGSTKSQPKPGSKTADVLRLYTEGYTSREAAILTGSTIGSVRSMVHRYKPGRHHSTSHRAKYDEILKAYEMGVPVLDIRDNFGLTSHATVYSALRVAGLKPNRLRTRRVTR